ncbi:MAG TPA: chemotaxis protein, partial [Xanthobacteraceae bacterium]|nr:chemotaxis protein [Xanthobacteraceae bacterium]
MAAPRKIFRIEEMAASRLPEAIADAQAPLRHAELMAEVAALRETLAALRSSPNGAAAAPREAETAHLKCELDLIAGAIAGGEMAHDGAAASAAPATAPLKRMTDELMEVVTSTEQATQQVLAAAEAIDQVANHLAAALTGKYEQGLAHDIQDLVIRIFEACNFQDLAGQRVGKVLASLTFVEEHVTRLIEEIKNPSTAARRDG